MRGTLALWYEPLVRAKGRSANPNHSIAPTVELHFNLWRDFSSSINALDVGFKLGGMAGLSRFYLYVPGELRREQLSDLAPVLRIGSTLNAVFNDVVGLGAETDDGYDVSLNGREQLSVFFIQPSDLVIEPFKEDETTIGSRLVFTEALCNRIKAASNVFSYIRIRIELIDRTADLFSSELVARDRFFASAIGRLELTELRLNERRSYPPRISELADRHDFDITAVHYFLIRDLQHRLVVQHAPFRKVRRLERDLWADYLAGDTSRKRFKLGAKLASRFVIYHWREKRSEDATLDGFIAFASFSASSPSLLTYAVIIILLGATGSALAAGLGAHVISHAPHFLGIGQWCGVDQVCGTEIVSFALVALLTVSIAFLIMALSLTALASKGIQRGTRWVSSNWHSLVRKISGAGKGSAKD